ncbi:hypothetical protein AWC05_11150 [Mycobacterium florentinum]|uniref:Uncharacterized protein n=1 Tax=Mycobacterium florentinum TaxID=292462 RepID=A0A1X1UGX2_MYCFL|nr:hypothetical protein [Mycobacterium florentinum]MCV7413144.1 hypothetical protein [Mycobacterium florentinum]ORV56085.1 hypothetical protein AWC05_11150 [Mycobacterium florentinum]BBX76668.1 hypothetical protein MFLOJ_04550 [Mycobacterium florentinum]
MPLYVRHTRPARIVELPRPICGKLAEHAAAHQIDLNDVRVWLTHSENPPASSAFGKLLRRRANPVDPDEEHWTAVVLHPTQLLVATEGAKRGTAVLSLPLAQASMTTHTIDGDPAGFTITGFPGEQTGSYYVGLGPEPDAAGCVSAVHEAIGAAKR